MTTTKEELEKKIEDAAHKIYPYGSTSSIGSKMRAMYEEKHESFVAGANSREAKALWQHGMYTEIEVFELLKNCHFEDVNIIEWFELNKKKS